MTFINAHARSDWVDDTQRDICQWITIFVMPAKASIGDIQELLLALKRHADKSSVVFVKTLPTIVDLGFLYSTLIFWAVKTPSGCRLKPSLQSNCFWCCDWLTEGQRCQGSSMLDIYGVPLSSSDTSNSLNSGRCWQRALLRHVHCWKLSVLS